MNKNADLNNITKVFYRQLLSFYGIK